MLNKIVYVSFGIILSSIFLFLSCSTNPKGPPSDRSPGPGISGAQQDVHNTNASLTNTTATIKKEATAGMDKTPSDHKQQLDPHWREILTQAGIQEQLIKQLDQTEKNLGETKKKSDQLELDLKASNEALAKEKENVTKEARQKYLNISIACFAGLVLSGVLIFMGQTWAKGVSIACAAGLALSLFLAQTLQFIPWVVGGILGIVALVVLIEIIKKNNLIDLFKKATAQVVKTAETAKPFMTLEGRRKVFGEGPIVGLAHVIQDESTMKIVSDVRENISTASSVPARIAADYIPADYNGDGVIDEKDEELFREESKSGSVDSSPVDPAFVDTASSSSASAKLKKCAGSRKITGPIRAQIVLN